MRRNWTRMLTPMLVAALVAYALPTACAAEEFSDTSSEGAAITIGLFIAAVVVLFIVGVREDVSNVFGKSAAPVDSEKVAADVAAVAGEIPMGGAGGVNAASGLAQIQGSGVGFRVEF